MKREAGRGKEEEIKREGKRKEGGKEGRVKERRVGGVGGWRERRYKE